MDTTDFHKSALQDESATFTRLQRLPVLIALIAYPTIILTYIAAALQGHVPWIFPLISDTAATPPEQCFFSEMMNLTCFLGIASVYIRNRDLWMKGKQAKKLKNPVVRRFLKSHLQLGISCIIGLNILSNFQNKNLPKIHLFGALLFFFSGEFMLTADLSLSKIFNVHKRISELFIVKIIILIMSIVSAILFGCLTATDEILKDYLKQHPADVEIRKIDYYCVTYSAVFEWITVFLTISYFLTLYPALKTLTFKMDVSETVVQ